MIARARGRSNLAGNNTEHWERIYSQHSSLVFYYLRQKLRSVEDAEDATVETFRRVLSGLKGMRGKGVASIERAYVLRIATNVAMRVQRQTGRRLEVELGPQHLDIATMVQVDLEERTLERLACRKQVHELMAELPEQQRMAVLLRIGYEMSDSEVAEVLSVPVGTVKCWVWRALVKLRENHKALYQEVQS